VGSVFGRFWGLDVNRGFALRGFLRLWMGGRLVRFARGRFVRFARFRFVRFALDHLRMGVGGCAETGQGSKRDREPNREFHPHKTIRPPQARPLAMFYADFHLFRR
jgi:hypothetical protein